jgi:hypothetical protein
LWNTAESPVALEEKLTGVQGFRLEGRAVGKDEPPMSDFTAEQVDETSDGKSRRMPGSAGLAVSEKTSRTPLSFGRFGLSRNISTILSPT